MATVAGRPGGRPGRCGVTAAFYAARDELLVAADRYQASLTFAFAARGELDAGDRLAYAAREFTRAVDRLPPESRPPDWAPDVEGCAV